MARTTITNETATYLIYSIQMPYLLFTANHHVATDKDPSIVPVYF